MREHTKRVYQSCFLSYQCISPHTCCLRQVHRSRHRRRFGFQSTWLCQLSSLRLPSRCMKRLQRIQNSVARIVLQQLSSPSRTHFSNSIGSLSSCEYSLSWLPLPTKSYAKLHCPVHLWIRGSRMQRVDSDGRTAVVGDHGQSDIFRCISGFVDDSLVSFWWGHVL